MSKLVRIGCASGFWGDSQLAARQLVAGGELNYLVFDYLAEITMALLSNARAKDERLGFAVDFVTVAMRDVLADCARKNIKVVANAGGVNVPGCVAALTALCADLGIERKIAGVYGDDLSAQVDTLRAHGLPEMQTGAPLPDKLASINAYLGARPIADALAAGADIVVTGRVVDSALVLGPLLHEYNWAEDDYDKLAQGSLAGHVIECGAQCCGGNFSDWAQVPDFANIGYPVVEVEADGQFTVTKPPHTGGLVSTATVAEQIVYEIGDPANYLLPDVACDFTGVQLEQLGEHRVRVSGARGRAPGNRYKVCATWRDGYRLTASFFMAGHRAAAKAQINCEAWLQRCRSELTRRGVADFRAVDIELIGTEAVYGEQARGLNSRELMAKIALHHDSREALQFAAGELAYLATSGVPGLSGYAAGRPKPQPLMRLHSALLDKSVVTVIVQLNDRVIHQRSYTTPQNSAPAPGARYDLPLPHDEEAMVDVPVERLAWARSGDKGDNANIGVIARRADYLPYLQAALTPDAVGEYFSHLVKGRVERYALPGFNAFNFLLTEALGGGGTASLRVDPQGKTFAQMLLSMPVRVPEGLLEGK